TVDELRNLVPELVPDLVERGLRVLDDVVEQRSRDRLLIELQAGEDERNPVRVVNEVLAGAPLLPLVRPRREVERAAEQFAIDVGVVGSDLGEQLVDEALISLVKLEDRHGSSVLRAFAPPCSRNPREGTIVVTVKWACPCSSAGATNGSSWSSRGCSPHSTRTRNAGSRPQPVVPSARRGARGTVPTRAGCASRRSRGRARRRSPVRARRAHPHATVRGASAPAPRSGRRRRRPGVRRAGARRCR